MLFSFVTFNFVCAIIHAIGEVVACLLFYTTTTLPNIDLMYVVFVLVGGGTIVHSMVDGYIALYIYKAIQDYLSLRINNRTLS